MTRGGGPDPVSHGAHKTLGSVAGIITGIVAVAIVAVIFGSRSQAPAAIGSAGSAVSGIVGAAVQPVAGGGSSSFAPSSYSSPQTFTGPTGSSIPPFGSSVYGPGTGLTYPGPAGGFFT